MMFSMISHETKTSSEVDQADGYKRKEFSYSSFCRSFYIPENVLTDKIGASYKDGILTVELPKDKEEKQKLTKQVKSHKSVLQLRFKKEAEISLFFFVSICGQARSCLP